MAGTPEAMPTDEARTRGRDTGQTGEPRGPALAYALTWLAYATYYLGRKGFSVTKSRISHELGLGAPALAAIETTYLVAYAAGQFLSGALADRVGARRLVGVGMLVSAAACAAFGHAGGAAAFFLAFAVNGLAQSTGWPGTNKAMSEWTTKATRGRVMGLWATCYQIGGIAATVVATYFLAHHGWRAAFYGPALIVAAVGLLVLALLPRGPHALSATTAAERAEPTALAEKAKRDEERRRVLRSPTLYSYGASYFSIKLIRYCLLFWLPYYLHTSLGYAEGSAGYLSTAFEIGGAVGAAGLGYLSDRLRNVSRPVLSALSLGGLATALVLYGKLGASGVVMNAVLLALVGALLFGPDALLSGAAAQDAGGPYAAATAVGIVNGVGSLGALLQGAVTVGVRDAFGWNALFYVLSGLALLAAVCLTPAMRRRKAPDSVDLTWAR